MSLTPQQNEVLSAVHSRFGRPATLAGIRSYIAAYRSAPVEGEIARDLGVLTSAGLVTDHWTLAPAGVRYLTGA